MAEAEAEGEIGKFLFEKVAGALVGQAASQFIGTPLTNALGLGPTDNSAAYVAQVMAAIQALGDQLSQQINLVQTGIDNVAALSLQISAYQHVEGLSDILQRFNEHATVIDTVFSEFQADAASLSASDPKANAAAASDMYQRLTSNDTAIAIAMGNIHNLVVPTAGTQGILEHLCDVVRQAVMDAAQAAMANPVTNMDTPITDTPGADWSYRFKLPADGAYHPAKLVVDGAPAAVDGEIPTVISIMQSILAAQLKGLFLLTRTWTGGTQEVNLKGYIDRLLAEAAAMKDFYRNCCTSVDRAISDALRQFSKPLNGSMLQMSWVPARPTGDIGSYIVWSVLQDRTRQHVRGATIVQQPWDGARHTVYSVMAWGNPGEPASVVSSVALQYGRNKSFDRVMGIELGTFDYPQPTALTNLLSNLPTSRADLGSEQPHWAMCKQCSGLFFTLAASTCSTGKPHDPISPHRDYSLFETGTSAPDGMQDNWRGCKKCGVLHYGALASACFAGGAHEVAGSGNFAVANAVGGDPFATIMKRQRNWRWCPKCGALHQGDASGICPGNANHAHSSDGSGEYWVSYLEQP